MPAGLYFKLIMIVILIILDYFFPRTEIVGQVAWGWKFELWANKCNNDRTGTHYLITKMIQTTCRWIVSLVNSCECGLEVKGIDLEIRRSLFYFQLRHPFAFWPSASHDCVNTLALIFNLYAWCEASASVFGLKWYPQGYPGRQWGNQQQSPDANSSGRYKLWDTFASRARILAQDEAHWLGEVHVQI